MFTALEQQLQAVWYGGRAPALWMKALSLIYRGLLVLKRLTYKLRLRRVQSFEIPVVVVGNITVGGTGKTPLVLRLVELLRASGYQPGVISRGYGSSAGGGPLAVNADSKSEAVGDEPLLIHQRSGVPVMVGSNRVAAIRRLLADHSVDIIISDDGLQHQEMGRDLEIVVIDGDRRFGNARLLPAGPLREPASRLDRVDFTLVNGGDETELSMHLEGNVLERLQDGSRCPLTNFDGQAVVAIAGVGNPERFFKRLEAAGVVVDRHPFPDHHRYSQSDLAKFVSKAVIMTEKDAVKCRALTGTNWWVLPITAQLPSSFETELLGKLEQIRQ